MKQIKLKSINFVKILFTFENFTCLVLNHFKMECYIRLKLSVVNKNDKKKKKLLHIKYFIIHTNVYNFQFSLTN